MKKDSKKKTSGVHFNDDDNMEYDFDDVGIMCSVSTPDSRRRPPYIQRVDINGTMVDMHIDTGSSVLLLPESTWILLGKPRLFPSPCMLRSYTGDKLNILGEFRGRVSINGSTQVMPVTVTRGSNVPLLDRDWLEIRRIDWPS